MQSFMGRTLAAGTAVTAFIVALIAFAMDGDRVAAAAALAGLVALSINCHAVQPTTTQSATQGIRFHRCLEWPDAHLEVRAHVAKADLADLGRVVAKGLGVLRLQFSDHRLRFGLRADQRHA